MKSISIRLRLWSSRLSSLFLLFQRSPIIQLIFPEAKILGGSAIADTATLAIATIAGLGAFDSVAGASNSVVQVSPVAGSSTVSATVGVALTFVYGIATSDTPTSFTITSGTLPSGLTKSPIISSKKNYISGTPAAGTQGSYPITITASDPQYSTTGNFTIVVAAAAATPPAITTNPASTTTINSGATTTLNVIASGTAPLIYKWYQGAVGVTTTPVGTNSAAFTTPPLTTTTSYWVNVSNTAYPAGVNSTATTVNVTVTVPAAIASQPPSSTTINYGATASLSITASGTALTYQWYQGLSGDTSTPISNSNSPSFTTPALLTSPDYYWVRVTNTTTVLNTADSGTAVVTVRNPFDTWMFVSGSSVPAGQNGLWNIPQGDGITNILKFAFNLDPTKADIRQLTVGAGNIAGLPGMTLNAGKLRLEFIRRKGSPGIIYTPQFGSDPSVWTDATSPAATSIDTTWERVVVDDPHTPTGARRFGRVSVTPTP